MTEFFNMGGYAVYVWPSFAIGFLVLVMNVVTSLARHKKALRKAQDYNAENHTNED